MPANRALIQARGLVKIHKVADLEVVALQGLDLEVSRGEFVALVGPSGAGKSTLLNALGGLDRPSAGQLRVGDLDLLGLSPAQLTAYRRERVGFVWQQTARNLLPYLSARANVELLMTLAGRPARARRAWASELLAAVGVAAAAARRPPELSGGQQQRVAIACALANQPQILLGDEPTGEIDWPTAERMLALLGELRSRYGITIVLVTHDPRVAARADRVVAIRDGRVSSETLHREGRTTDDGRRIASVPPSREANPPLSSLHRPASEELLVLDATGRVQLPAALRRIAGIGRRARVELTDAGLLVLPGDDGPAELLPSAEPDTDPAVLAREIYQG